MHDGALDSRFFLGNLIYLIGVNLYIENDTKKRVKVVSKIMCGDKFKAIFMPVGTIFGLWSKGNKYLYSKLD